MPKAKAVTTTTSQAPDPTPAAAPALVYPEIIVTRCWGKDAITGPQAAQLLGLMTEDEAAAEAAQANGLASNAQEAKKLGFKLERWTFQMNDKEDARNDKVICKNTTENRMVDMTVVRCHQQDVLHRNWAGPTTIPGETVNGETITIGRNGQVISGQKRLIGLWLAWLEWKRNPEKWKHFWPTEPVLETLLVYGISNHPRVVQTVDNVQPRSEADTFYTTGAAGRILGKADEQIAPKQKQELCRMLQTALDWLWRRTGMSERAYKTNRAAQDFLDGHPKLYQAVKHIFDLNQGRALSLLRLSPGTSASAMLLMAQSKTDPTKWQEAGTPTEKALDLGLWSKAQEFWTGLSTKEGQFKVLADALAKLHNIGDDAEGLGGRAVEKLCVLAKAWNLYQAGQKITTQGIALEYGDNDGVTVIIDPPGFGGIDLGPVMAQPVEEGSSPTPEEIEAEKKAERDRRAQELLANRNKRVETGQANGNGKPAAPVLVINKPAAQVTSTRPAPTAKATPSKPVVPAKPKPVVRK